MMGVRLPLGVKAYQIVTVLACLSVSLVWANPVLKLAVLPLGLAFLLRNHTEDVIALTFSIFICAIYLSEHGIRGSYDLKILLVILQFIVVARLFSTARRPPSVDLRCLALTQVIVVIYAVLSAAAAFSLNVNIGDTGRFRGVFLFPLALLLFVSLNSTIRTKLIVAGALSALGFLISGTRSEAASLLLMALGSLLPRRLAIVAMPLAFIAPQIFAYAYLAQGWSGGVIDNISIRALTQTLTFNELSPFGKGITPPLDIFFRTNHFSHYFVPADAGALGFAYEVGVFAYALKVVYIGMLIILIPRTASVLPIIGACYFLFGYGLTYDVAGLAFSVAVLLALPPTSRRHRLPRRVTRIASSNGWYQQTTAN